MDSGADLAAALQTIVEDSEEDMLQACVASAFDGGELEMRPTRGGAES